MLSGLKCLLLPTFKLTGKDTTVHLIGNCDRLLHQLRHAHCIQFRKINIFWYSKVLQQIDKFRFGKLFQITFISIALSSGPQRKMQLLSMSFWGLRGRCYCYRSVWGDSDKGVTSIDQFGGTQMKVLLLQISLGGLR